MVSKPAYRELALTYLWIKEMPTYGEVGPQPAEDGGQSEDPERVAAGEESQAEVGAVGRGERGDLVVEQRERRIDQPERNGPARQPLQQARVIERPAHKAVGGAEELRDLDLVALREDLQPDGVEG